MYFDQRSLEPHIDFNWTLINNFSYYQEIQLNFSRPLSVSVGDTPDVVVVLLTAMIVDKTTDLKVRRNFRLSAPLPMLVSSAAELKKLNAISNTFENSAKSLFYAYLLINLLFSFAMGMLRGTF